MVPPDPAVDELLPAFAAEDEPMLGGQTIAEWRATSSVPVLVTVEKLIARTATPTGLDDRSLPR